MAEVGIIAKNITRVLTGFAFGLIILFSLLLGSIPLLAVVFIVLILGSNEYIKILETKGMYPQKTVLIIACSLMIFIASLQRFDLMQVILTLATIFVFIDVILKNKKPYIANVSSTILGIVYCGWLPAHIILLRNLGIENFNLLKFDYSIGLGFVLLLLFSAVATDVGGWYFGSRFGKKPLAPEISPKKTIEGAVYGTTFAIIIATLTGLFLPIPLWYSTLGGLLISIFAQFGDLAESLLKRDAGVKDSGQTLPGHGGFLDRVDGYIFAAPIAYYYFKFFVPFNEITMQPYITWDKITALFGF